MALPTKGNNPTLALLAPWREKKKGRRRKRERCDLTPEEERAACVFGHDDEVGKIRFDHTTKNGRRCRLRRKKGKKKSRTISPAPKKT